MPAPPSPVKRVTRSRAKATTNGSDEQRVGVAGAVDEGKGESHNKSRAKSRSAAAGMKTAKIATPGRKARDAASSVPRDAAGTADETISVDEKSVASDGIKDAQAATKGPRTRGRPRKTAPAPAPIVRSLPGAAAATTTIARGTATASSTSTDAKRCAPSAVRKKVTWHDEGAAGKENVVPASMDLGKTQGVEIQTKPPRRTGTATRKGSKQKAEEVEKPALSPKKSTQVTQQHAEPHLAIETPSTPKPASGLTHTFGEAKQAPVARGGIVAATPVRCSSMKKPLSTRKASPTKLAPLPSTIHEDITGSDDELARTTAGGPPTKVDSTLMMSPPKRMPVSPFRFSLKESPVRANIILPRHRSPLKSTDNVTQSLGASMLQKSPQKAKLPTSPTKTTSANATDLLNSSLFATPAKRGNISKTSSGSVQLSASLMRKMTASAAKPVFSPAKNVTSAFRAMRSPSASAKVHKMTAEEMAVMNGNASLLETPGKRLPSYMADTSAAKRRTSPAKRSILSPARQAGRQTSSPTSGAAKLSETGRSRGNSLKSRSVSTPGPAFSLFRSQEEDDAGSEDELSATPDFSARLGINSRLSTPMLRKKSPAVHGSKHLSMTALANKFQNWGGQIPAQPAIGRTIKEIQPLEGVSGPVTPASRLDEDAEEETLDFVHVMRSPERLTMPQAQASPRNYATIFVAPAQPDPSYVDDALAICEDLEGYVVENDEPDTNDYLFGQSQLSVASQEYGDENVPPADVVFLDAHDLATPHKDEYRVEHTISKVPLKPSVSWNSSPTQEPYAVQTTKSETVDYAIRPSAFTLEECTMADLSTGLTPVKGLSKQDFGTPQNLSASWPPASSPMRTPRQDLNRNLLSGAVVFVDVHTAEGADASHIFVELLGQMGARCIKQWSWNSRASMREAPDVASLEASQCKVGITHVVYKDGGRRTLEKVKEAEGLVQCVGVSWVLDCEKENKWLDESLYAIDLSLIPRGGSRRRKSMEPRPATSLTSGTLFSPVPESSGQQLSPTKEFLNLDTPFATPTQATRELPQRQISFASPSQQNDMAAPITPIRDDAYDFSGPLTTPGGGPSAFDSPTTPYYLHATHLVQQTCPPKRTQELLFPLSGRIGDHADADVRKRLLLARRKSLQFVPKVGSPLARDG